MLFPAAAEGETRLPQPSRAEPVLDPCGGAETILVVEDNEGIVMPGGINGLVLAERARVILPGLRVLLTTGYNEDLVSLRGPGVFDVLNKPYRETELTDRV